MIKKLNNSYRLYGLDFTANKLELLIACSRKSFLSASELKNYHRILLFLEAFPDDPKIYRLVLKEKERVALLVSKVIKRNPMRARVSLADTGMPGTLVEVSLSLAATSWISHKAKGSLSVDWRDLDRNEELQSLLNDLVFSPISDGILYSDLSNREIFEMVSGPAQKSAPTWLLSHFAYPGLANQFVEHCYDKLDLWVTWQLGQHGMSLTQARFPKRDIVYHPAGLCRTLDVANVISQRLPAERKLSKTQARKIIDTSRIVLYIQGRETDSVDYASPADATLFSLDSGVDILLLGTRPSRRRFLESFVGFIVAKNRVPFAYGGAWIIGQKADIGINIFEWMRGGESALAFSELLRVYHHRFGVNVFEVEPYQFGGDNDEGLASGAFWFYWKMGFRSIESGINRLAQSEEKKLKKAKKYRTPVKVLKRLVQDKLRYSVGEANATNRWSISVQALGVYALKQIGLKYGGDLLLAKEFSTRQMMKTLKIRNFNGWSADERESFAQLSLLFVHIPKLQSWTKSERDDLKFLMRAKGGLGERDYVLRFAEHKKLQAALLCV